MFININIWALCRKKIKRQYTLFKPHTLPTCKKHNGKKTRTLLLSLLHYNDCSIQRIEKNMIKTYSAQTITKRGHHQID
jgi:hypothetical protein